MDIKKTIVFAALAALVLGSAFTAINLLSNYFHLKVRRQEPVNHGLNMAQWLKTLSANRNSNESPLAILSITQADVSNVIVQVPLAYDLLQKYDFINGDGKLNMLMNGKTFSHSFPNRTTNGNCELWLESKDFRAGTNQIQIEFMIQDHSNKDSPLRAFGPVTEYLFSNNPVYHTFQ